YQYDSLSRRTFAGFGTTGTPPTYESTINNFAYDGSNRILHLTDSVTGLITFNYDDVNRTVSEANPVGTVTSVFDAAGRRTSMTVVGQPAVSYSYDNANRLYNITQG